MSHPPSYARRFLPIWGMGLIGVAALLLQEPPAAVLDRAPQLRELPSFAVRLLLLVNPLTLVTVMAAVGAALAHRVCLRSALSGDTEARLDVRAAMAVAAVLASTLTVVDALIAGLLGPDWQRASAQVGASPWLPTLLLGVLYGGIAEEVIMRWGLMSLVTWGALRLQGHRAGNAARPAVATSWAGVVVAATIFAVGHLPALAQSVELNAPIVARTLGLNMLAGIAYGWLFWRRSLECAMLAHAATHFGLAIGRLLT